MLKINIIAVGRVKDKFYTEAAAEYLKRLSRFCRIEVIEIKESTHLEEAAAIKEEGEAILKAIKGNYIVLTPEGEQLKSEAFAELIKVEEDFGRDITFIIGGSYGLSKTVKEKSIKRLSFSKMTFPHTFFRVMLLEQIYRAFKINENSSYHK